MGTDDKRAWRTLWGWEIVGRNRLLSERERREIKRLRHRALSLAARYMDLIERDKDRRRESLT